MGKITIEQISRVGEWYDATDNEDNYNVCYLPVKFKSDYYRQDMRKC